MSGIHRGISDGLTRIQTAVIMFRNLEPGHSLRRNPGLELGHEGIGGPAVRGVNFFPSIKKVTFLARESIINT